MFSFIKKTNMGGIFFVCQYILGTLVSKEEKEKLQWRRQFSRSFSPSVSPSCLFYVSVCGCETWKPSRFQINVCFVFVKRGFRTRLWMQEKALNHCLLITPYFKFFFFFFSNLYIVLLLLFLFIIIILCKTD